VDDKINDKYKFLQEAKWRLILSEKAKVTLIERQIKEASQILNHGPLIIFITSIVGGDSLLLSAAISLPLVTLESISLS
jgi:hypothetical protein